MQIFQSNVSEVLRSYFLIYAILSTPLSSFPGPRLWALSRLPYAITVWQGNLHTRVKELHDQYGEVVRVAPNELSLNDYFMQRGVWVGIIVIYRLQYRLGIRDSQIC